MFATAPGVIFYTGQFIPDHLKGKGGASYKHCQGIALEVQTYPDSIDMDPTSGLYPEYLKGRCDVLSCGVDPNERPVMYHNNLGLSFGWG